MHTHTLVYTSRAPARGIKHIAKGGQWHRRSQRRKTRIDENVIAEKAYIFRILKNAFFSVDISNIYSHRILSGTLYMQKYSLFIVLWVDNHFKLNAVVFTMDTTQV